MNKYIFQFTPTCPYFFGAENRRQDINKAKDDTANYYLKSFAFPQQSTVLGAVRYFFLQNVCPTSVFANNEIKDKSQAGAPAYIGDKSFDIAGTTFNFGKIKRISEVFLRKSGQNYLALPFDKWSDDFGNVSKVASLNLYFLPQYDVKNYYETRFTNGSENVSFSKIFKEHVQSGNKKKNEGDDDEDGFYKQQYYQLEKEWSFAIELETDVDLSHLQKSPLFMNMGGENRIFKIEIMDTNFDRNKILQTCSHPQFTKLVITSDTFFAKAIPKDAAIFSFIQSKSFRYLSSKIATTTQYNNRSKDGRSMVASNLYELIERGGVFFFANDTEANQFANNYLNNPYLRNAGMNQYVILTSKS